MIRFGFFSIMLILLYVFTGDLFSLLSILAALVHECGHLIAARIMNIKISNIKLDILGARINITNGIYSYYKEAALCAAGPTMNFFTSFICRIALPQNEITNIFIIFSLGLGILNLLPIKSFDGGRIFEALLLNRLQVDSANRILDLSSFIFVFILWSISVYFLLKYSSSLNLFIFSASLFSSLFINDYCE